MTKGPKTDEPSDGVPTAVGPAPVNGVVVQGRVSADPVRKEMPSGDVLTTFRVVVPRPPASASERRPRPTVDTLDCAVWGGRVRRTVSGWRSGDEVEVRGALRRRFYRSATGPVSRVEIEVVSGRLIRRSGSASARRDSASAGTTSPSPEAVAP